MFAMLKRAFRPLDTSAVEAAIAEAKAEQHQVRVRARALRMDISCGAPGVQVDTFMKQVTARAGAMLREIYEPQPGPLPAPLQQLLDRL